MTTFEKNNAIGKAKRVERVAAYIRVSTTEQKLHGISLDAQVAKLTEYAEKHNMKIVEWYKDEGVSGRKLIKKRPELQRMMQDAKKGDFERIIMIKLDRFFRSVAEYHEFMKEIAPVVWTATEEKYDLTTAQGRMLVNFKLTIAEMEADTAGERVTLVNEYKASTGQPLTGSMPISHTIVRDSATGRKKIVRNPETEDAVRDTIAYYMLHQSKRKALIYLHTVHHIAISKNSLSTLLRNPMLYGAYRDNPNYCEAYMTKEEWEKMQSLSKKNIKANTSDGRVYKFSGLIKCPECNRKLAGVHQRTFASKEGKVYKYNRYRCQHHIGNAMCGWGKSISENTFEKMLLANIEQCFENEKIESIEITDSNAPKIPKYDIEEIHEQIDRLNYSWQTGKIRKVETYEKDFAELMERLELAEAEQKTTVKKDYTKIDVILKEGWKEIYKALDDDHRRAFWRSFISSIEIEWDDDIKRIKKVNFF